MNKLYNVNLLITDDKSILADEMGLGKTVQICAFLAGLKASGVATHFMVAYPMT